MQARCSFRALALVVVLAALLSLPFLGRAFYTRGEPREAIVAQSMLKTGNWISPPAYNGAVPSKPPFLHWLMALSSLPGGEVTEVTARLPSALAFVIFAGSFFVFLAHRLGNTTALLSCLILLSSPEWLRGGATCRVDTLLSTCLAGALLALFRWREGGFVGIPWLVMALLSGAALTKGPVGLVLPLAAFSLFRICEEGISRNVLVRVAAGAALVALPVAALVSAWYIAGYVQRGPEFLDKIWYENIQRFTGNMDDEPHKHSMLYLLGMLAVMLLPWSLAWLLALTKERKEVWEATKAPHQFWSVLAPIERFAIISAASIVVFFCVPASKRTVYLLPCYPFIAMVAAIWISRWEPRAGALLRRLTVMAVSLSLLLLMIMVALVLVPLSPDTARLGSSIVEATSCLKWIGLALGLAFVCLLAREAVGASAVGRLAVGLILAVVLAGPTVVDGVMLQISPKQWLESPTVRSVLRPDLHQRYYSFGSEPYAASFYLNRPFFAAPSQLLTGMVIFLEERNLGRFSSQSQADFREIARYSSGFERQKDLIAVEIVGRANNG